VARLSSARRAARGCGVRPFSSSLALMNASIGERFHSGEEGRSRRDGCVGSIAELPGCPERRSHMSSQPRTRLAIGVLLLCLAFVVGLSIGCGSPAPAVAPERVTIPSGASLGVVADSLEAHALLGSRKWFQLLARIRRVDRNLQAGTYEIPRGSSAWKMLTILASGRVVVVRFTVPEGITLLELAGMVQDELHIPAESKTRSQKSIWIIFLFVAVASGVAMFFAWPRESDKVRTVGNKTQKSTGTKTGAAVSTATSNAPAAQNPAPSCRAIRSCPPWLIRPSSARESHPG